MIQEYAVQQKSISNEEVQFTDLYQHHASRIFHYVLHHTRNEELAEDVTQDTFEKVWRIRSKIVPERVIGWLYTVAHHTMIDYIRQNRRASSLEEHTDLHGDELSSGTDLQEQQAFATTVTAALRRLTPRHREVLYLNIIAGYAPHEYMSCFGYTLNTARTTLARAREAFRQSYSRNCRLEQARV